MHKNMKKTSISLMALLALFMTACTEDYTVTNDLTVNLPESTLEVSDVTVTPPALPASISLTI